MFYCIPFLYELLCLMHFWRTGECAGIDVLIVLLSNTPVVKIQSG